MIEVNIWPRMRAKPGNCMPLRFLQPNTVCLFVCAIPTRRPHLPQHVVPCVEKFVDEFWLEIQCFGLSANINTATVREGTVAQ